MGRLNEDVTECKNCGVYIVYEPANETPKCEHCGWERQSLADKEMDKLNDTTILELAHQLETALMNDLLHEDTTILEFIKKYLNE